VNSLPEPTEASEDRLRHMLERAILVPTGALLMVVEEVIGVAATLADAEKAGRELVHFEERGRRARAHVEHLVHHHRGRVADRLDDRIERARHELNALASRGKGVSSKIRPHLPTNT
jgi:chaperonin cofactor prefoldin